MVRIDWQKFFWDHVWFGYYLDWQKTSLFLPGPDKLVWRCSDRWMDRLWPMRYYGEVYPKWWFKLWGDYDAAEDTDDKD